MTTNEHFPGSAVAVEHIFSGGHDTISLCRASLKPETIRILMLVKRRLVLAREIHFIIFKYTVFTAVYPFFYLYRTVRYFECLNTVRLMGECNRKVPVK